MRIKRTAWHYRLLLVWHSGSHSRDHNMPKNLCVYVTKLLIMFFLIYPAVALFAIIFGLCYPIGLGVSWLWGRCLPRKQNAFKNTLFGQWIKAKKEKVCPLIEYVNEGEKT